MSKFILQQLINFCIFKNKQVNHKKYAINWKREDAALENISIISKIHRRYLERWTIEFTDLYIYSNTFNPNFVFLLVKFRWTWFGNNPCFEGFCEQYLPKRRFIFMMTCEVKTKPEDKNGRNKIVSAPKVRGVISL